MDVCVGGGLLIFISSSVYTSEHAGGDGMSLRNSFLPKEPIKALTMVDIHRNSRVLCVVLYKQEATAWDLATKQSYQDKGMERRLRLRKKLVELNMGINTDHQGRLANKVQLSETDIERCSTPQRRAP